MKILIYPGTFDPIRGGHIDTLRRAMREKDYDKVYILLQTNIFKDGTMFTYDARLKFIADALEENSMYRVDIIKTDSPYLHEAMKMAGVFDEQAINRAEVDVLIGDDILGSIEKWSNFEFLRLRFNFVVVERTLSDREICAECKRIFLWYSIIPVNNKEKRDITSTEVRHVISSFLKQIRRSRTSILTRD